MLHIHNGDASANIAKQSSLPGEHFAFREALIGGPTPAGLASADWTKMRAQHLSESYGVGLEQCEQELLAQEAKLATSDDHEGVVLWFEHDLFCQLHLIYLLDWFAKRGFKKTTLSLVCVGSFPGKENFRGLGELTDSELASLFPQRKQVTQEQMNIAGDAWQAYCSAVPSDIEEMVTRDTSELPFLKTTLIAHLRRFPSTANGLGAIENTALEIVAGGSKSFIDVFAQFGEAQPVYGLGDAQLWLALQRMSSVNAPLIEVHGNSNGWSVLTPDVAKNALLSITETGKALLKSDADFVSLNGIDLWLGGVHLKSNNLWRWDEVLGMVSG